MKSKKVYMEQYAYETKYLEGDNEKFLDSIAPVIGYIVYEFNSLEESLTSFICELISESSDDKGLIITYKMGYSQKVDLFNRYTTWVQNICEIEIPNHNKLIQDLKECSRLRNMVVHAEWETVDKEGFTLIKVRIDKKGIQQEYVQFDLESLEKIRDIIVDTYNLLDEYREGFSSI